MMNIKKTLLLITLSIISAVQAHSTKYPYMSSYFSAKSLVRNQCEQNDEAVWGTRKIAMRCESLEKFFPSLIKRMDDNTPQETKFFYGEKSLKLMLAKREWIRELLLNKHNIREIRDDLDAILSPLQLSDEDKKKEEDLILGYILMTAEHEC